MTRAAALVRLTDGDLLQAERWARAVESSGIESRPNYTRISRPGRYLHGYIGELAFARLAKENNLLHRHRVTLLGASDEPEFLVWCSGKRMSLDVKTAADPRYTRMMLPAGQEQDADLYVAALIVSPGFVQIEGWCAREELARIQPQDFGHGPTIAVEFGKLSPIMDLLVRLDGQLRVIEAST